MPCMRCSTCGLDMPQGRPVCPVCGERTWLDVKGSPDPDWEWRATLLLHQREEAEEDEWDEWEERDRLITVWDVPFKMVLVDQDGLPMVLRVDQLDIYYHDRRRLLLKIGDALELNGTLVVVTALIRPKAGKVHYFLEPVAVHIPDTVPAEWC